MIKVMGSSAEQQLQQLEQDYRTKRAELERQAGERKESLPSEHETMSQVVQERIQQHVPSFQPTTSAPRNTDDSLPPEEQTKVQGWVTDVFTKGLDAGLKEARNSGDPALLDAFHAALTGQLHDVLVQRKKLEDVSQ